jgi:hypothetical protein
MPMPDVSKPETHALLKYEYQPGSFVPYRHFVACTCGFQARLETEEAAKSQFDNHLTAHGAKPYFASLSENKQPVEAVSTWKPTFGGGVNKSKPPMESVPVDPVKTDPTKPKIAPFGTSKS